MTTVADEIERASDAVRAANHATSCGLLDGPAAYCVVGALAELVDRLPQVLDHLARSLRRTHAAEHYDDRGRDPVDALTVAAGAVLSAHDRVAEISDHLHAAHNHLGHIGRHLSEED